MGVALLTQTIILISIILSTDWDKLVQIQLNLTLLPHIHYKQVSFEMKQVLTSKSETVS